MDKKVDSGHRRVARSEEAKETSPVIVQTMSGYEIWLDPASEHVEKDSEGALIFRFVVTSARHAFHVIRVEIPGRIQDQVRRVVGPSFSDDQRFWHTLAHNALANALEESTVPPEEHLHIEELTSDLLELARRWRVMLD